LVDITGFIGRKLTPDSWKLEADTQKLKFQAHPVCVVGVYRRSPMPKTLNIRFTGSKGVYSARPADMLSPEAKVFQGGDGWRAWFYGSPSKRNPWETDPETGRSSRSCMCPRIDLLETYPTRQAAAEAGILGAALEDDRTALVDQLRSGGVSLPKLHVHKV
jgi:hypothetical protein